MKLKTNVTSTKGPRTKIKNKKNKDWSKNINNKESQTIIFLGKREKKKKEKRKDQEVTHWTTTFEMHHSTKKKTWWRFQWQGQRAFLDAVRHRTSQLKGWGAYHVSESPPHASFLFISSINFYILSHTKLPISWIDIIKKKKKNYCKKTKKGLRYKF
jgi:hypothetical protein